MPGAARTLCWMWRAACRTCTASASPIWTSSLATSSSQGKSSALWVAEASPACLPSWTCLSRHACLTSSMPDSHARRALTHVVHYLQTPLSTTGKRVARAVGVSKKPFPEWQQCSLQGGQGQDRGCGPGADGADDAHQQPERHGHLRLRRAGAADGRQVQ